MKTKMFLIASIFCIFFTTSCNSKKEKEAQIISVVVSDTNGVLTYDWSRIKTVGNTTIIPTGIPIKEMAGNIISMRLVDRSQTIINDFEKEFNLQILSCREIGITDSTQVYLSVVHEAAPLVSNQTMQKADGLVDKVTDKVQEAWGGIKKAWDRAEISKDGEIVKPAKK
jgi:hypothetical protein